MSVLKVAYVTTIFYSMYKIKLWLDTVMSLRIYASRVRAGPIKSIYFRRNLPWWKRRKEVFYLCFSYNDLKAAEGPRNEPQKSTTNEPVPTKSTLYTYKHH